MKFIEKYARLCALLGVISVSTWGLGCANDSGSGDAPAEKETPAAEPETGSTTGGGTEAAGEEESTEEEKAE